VLLIHLRSKPSRRRGTALLWRHNDFREVENVLLPFASDGRTVDMIMMYTSVLRANGSRVRGAAYAAPPFPGAARWIARLRPGGGPRD
ncbi:MAG: hypothetical protein ACOVQI_02005, partial [Tagaea sp.]